MQGTGEMFSRIKTLYLLAYETRLALKNKEEVIFIFEKNRCPTLRTF